jgi:hypothetical protein
MTTGAIGVTFQPGMHRRHNCCAVGMAHTRPAAGRFLGT